MEALLQKLDRFADWIDRGCKCVLGIQTIALAVIVVAQVVLRRMEEPIGWATEFCCLIFIWMTLLGSAVASRYLLHIGVDALKDRLTGKVKKVFMIISHSILLVGLLIFTFSGFEYTVIQLGHVATTMPSISLSWFYCSLPICGAIMLYFTIIQFLQILHYGDVVKIEAADPEEMDKEVTI